MHVWRCVTVMQCSLECFYFFKFFDGFFFVGLIPEVTLCVSFFVTVLLMHIFATCPSVIGIQLHEGGMKVKGMKPRSKK